MLVSNASFQRVDCLIRGAAQVHIRIALRKFHLPGADVYGTGFPHHISAYMGVLISGAFLRFSNSITAGGGDLSATRSLIAGNGAAIDLDEGLPCNGMVDTIAAVVADFAAVHNEPDTRPVGLAADLDTVARVAGNLTAVHGEIGAVVHTNGKTLVVHNMGSLLNRGDDTAATLVGKINHAFRGGIVADGARKCVVGAVIGIDQAARTAGTTAKDSPNPKHILRSYR